jgi:peptide/nickel transport system substrate-binding protein
MAGQAPIGEPGPARPAAAKRIAAAVLGDPPFLYTKLNPRGTVGAPDDLLDLVHVGLTHLDRFGVRGPRLSEEVPSVDNGLWRVFPDGRMQLTWRLKPDVEWHDGVPFTADDLVFTASMSRDRDLPQLRDRRYDLIESVEALDVRTVLVTWKQAYIGADGLFTYDLALPVPRHVLESLYAESKAGVLEHPYWNVEFMGAGAYRLREFVHGSHLLLDANPRYVLGQPRIDVIEVKFIPQSNTLIANMLAGAVDVAIGRNISLDQALQMRESWQAGRMEIGYKSWHVLYPQFVNPTPALVAEVQFRRAVLHAIDRQEMADVLLAGLSSVAHNYLNPQEPEHGEVDARVVRYAYDPRLAMQMIDALGPRRGADGGFRGADGQPLIVHLQANAQLDIPPKASLAIADYWRRIGLGVETSRIEPQMLGDLERQATFPSFEVAQNPDDKRYLANFHSSNAPLPTNSFVGQNKPRYNNPEWDALLDRFFVTIPRQERVEVLGRIVAHIADQLPLMGLFYNVEPTMVNNRLLNVYARAQDSGQGRNVHEWELKE